MDVDHLLGLLWLPSELGKQFHDPGQLPSGNDGSSQILALLGFGCDAASINFEILRIPGEADQHSGTMPITIPG